MSSLPKRVRKPVDKFDPHPPGSPQMGADRVRDSRDRKSDRDRKRKKRDQNENLVMSETVADKNSGVESVAQQEVSMNNNKQAEENPEDMSPKTNSEK